MHRGNEAYELSQWHTKEKSVHSHDCTDGRGLPIEAETSTSVGSDKEETANDREVLEHVENVGRGSLKRGLEVHVQHQSADSEEEGEGKGADASVETKDNTSTAQQHHRGGGEDPHNAVIRRDVTAQKFIPSNSAGEGAFIVMGSPKHLTGPPEKRRHKEKPTDRREKCVARQTRLGERHDVRGQFSKGKGPCPSPALSKSRTQTGNHYSASTCSRCRMPSLLKFKTHKEERVVKCSRCQAEGHTADVCNVSRTCSRCLEEGHVAVDCPLSREAAAFLQPRMYVQGVGFVPRDQATRLQTDAAIPSRPRRHASPPKQTSYTAASRQRPYEQSSSKHPSKPPAPACPWLNPSATVLPSSATSTSSVPLRDFAAVDRAQPVAGDASPHLGGVSCAGATADAPRKRRRAVVVDDDPENSVGGPLQPPAEVNLGGGGGGAGGGGGDAVRFPPSKRVVGDGDAAGREIRTGAEAETIEPAAPAGDDGGDVGERDVVEEDGKLQPLADYEDDYDL